MAVITPLFLRFLAREGKETKKKIKVGIVLGCCFFILFGSTLSGGISGVNTARRRT